MPTRPRPRHQAREPPGRPPRTLRQRAALQPRIRHPADATNRTKIHRTEKEVSMPVWTSEPPTDDHGQSLRIIRTPSEKALDAIITSPTAVGCATHFVHNRTQPCEGQEHCKWCGDGHSWRWHGYVSCVIIGSLEHVLFEYTSAASDTFTNYHLLHNTLRACHFRAHRPSKRHNGRVVIAATLHDVRRQPIPEPVNVRKILCHVWGIPYDKVKPLKRTRRYTDRIGVDPGNGDARAQADQKRPPVP